MSLQPTEYALQPLEVNPPTATLVGDSAALTSVDFVPTAPIDLSGISTNTVRNVVLACRPGTLLLPAGQTVTVTVRVTTLQINQTVRVPPRRSSICRARCNWRVRWTW